VTREDLAHATACVGAFTSDNRAGIERTLHRISALRNRAGDVVGLTCRVGRAVFGTVEIIRDVVESGKSTLLLGPPGVGKTTLLREAARVLADEAGRRVIVVDTSNEIAGDGDIPHPGIGRARRMQVGTPARQHAVMIEAVENHMPEVIVIDEIGTEAEAAAARTIAERGVQLVATAHGHSLDNLLSNPTLADLLGGIQAVTLGDDEARRRRTQKTVLERKQAPTFDVLIEIQTRDRLAVHHDVTHVVDSALRGRPPQPELRLRHETGEVEIRPPAPEPPARAVARQRPKLTRIYPYAVSEERLTRAIRSLGAPATVARSVKDADLVLTLRTYAKRQPPKLRELLARDLPVHMLRSNSVAHIESFLATLCSDATHAEEPGLELDFGAAEAEAAAQSVLSRGEAVELSPQPSGTRRQQHAIAERFGLVSASRGREPYRRVVLFPAHTGV
jgi:stage III sporulation protein SpoIIIAA